MRRILAVLGVMVVLCMLASCSSGGITSADVDRTIDNGNTDDALGVAVSPQTLLLSSNQGGFVVVHTFIPYSTVNRTGLTLNFVPAFRTKADDCGNLVAYFNEAAIKAIVTPPDELMTLRGTYTNGQSFEGSDTVKVKE